MCCGWRSRLPGAASLYPGAAGAQTVLGLADVLARAREQAPQIVTARLAVAEARGPCAGASLRLQANPELDLNAGNRQGGGTRSTDLQFGINQMFEPGGRRAARIAAATAHVDQSAVAVEQATRDVLREAALHVLSGALCSRAYQAADRVGRPGQLDLRGGRSTVSCRRPGGARREPGAVGAGTGAGPARGRRGRTGFCARRPARAASHRWSVGRGGQPGRCGCARA